MRTFLSAMFWTITIIIGILLIIGVFGEVCKLAAAIVYSIIGIILIIKLYYVLIKESKMRKKEREN